MIPNHQAPAAEAPAAVEKKEETSTPKEESKENETKADAAEKKWFTSKAWVLWEEYIT